MLKNGDFSGRFYYYDDASEIYVPLWWYPFWDNDWSEDNPTKNRRPEFKRAGNEPEGQPLRAPKRGMVSVQLANNYSHHRAGIYQSFFVGKGNVVTVTAQKSAWYNMYDGKQYGGRPPDIWISERNADDPGYMGKLGLSLEGETNFDDERIVWSTPNYSHDQEWGTMTVGGLAKDDIVTVFLYGEPTHPVSNVNGYFANVQASVVEPAAGCLTTIPRLLLNGSS